MQTQASCLAAALVALALALPCGVAQAQLGNLLNQGSGGGQAANALGSLGNAGGALAGPAVTSNSLGNVTGLLTFCIKNHYLNAGTAGGIKDSLLGKLPGGANTTDNGYEQGASGILTAGNGSQLDLAGGGLKTAATRQVCNHVLSQAQSML